MNSTTSDKKQNAIHEWSKTNFGHSLLAVEQTEINKILPLFSGNYLAKIGGPKHNAFLHNSPIRQKIYLTTDASQHINHHHSTKNIIECAYNALPLSPESIDVALVHHVLEFEQNPHLILEEISKTLIPQGHIIIIGFNPKSLFGLQHYFTKNINANFTKFKQTNCISATRIKNWLEQLNFVITTHLTCYFRPHSQNATLLQTLQPLEKIGGLMRINCGACYILVAQKKLLGVTQIENHVLSKHLSFGYLKPSAPVNRSQTQ